jgi:hypothetical protein
MMLRRSAWYLAVALTTLLATNVAGPAPARAAATGTTVTGVPSAPFNVATRAGVDGVSVSWWQGSTASAPAPTSYVVRRRAEGHDLTWVVAAGTLTSGSTSDTTLPAGLPATYTVTARNPAGDSPQSAPASATVPAWSGPYSPARRVLTMVWDEGEGGAGTGRVTTQATGDASPPVSQDWANGLMGFSSGPGSEFALPLDTPDGDYSVGSGAGLLAVSARSGARCFPLNGASPSGSATVRRAAPSLFGYAAVSVDADLVCGDGHHLRVELRWSTPDDVHLLHAAPLTVLQAAPGEVTSRDVAVTNTGSVDATLGGARLVDANLSTAAPLTVTASTCEGRTLAPGASCALTIRYAAGASGSAEGNGFLALGSDLGELELGRVVGQQPAAVSGPQAVAVAGAPSGVDVRWASPTTLDGRLVAGWRIEEDAGPSPTVLARLIDYTRSTRLTGLSVGDHMLRVVMRTDDGREVSTTPLLVTVPRRWLLVATRDGVRALDPDGGHSDGGLFGARKSAVGVASSPTRDKVVVAFGPFTGSVDTLTAKGDPTRSLTIQPLFGDDGPAVSPDGVRVVVHRAGYSGPEVRDSSLVIVPTGGGSETAVPASSGLSAPSWTPDGAAVVAAQDSGAGLVKVAVPSGARTPLPGTARGRAPSISRTGRVAYIWRDPAAGTDEIRLTSLDGAATSRLGIHDGLWDLAWDPTGRWLAATGGPYGSTEHSYVYDTAATPALVRTLAGGSAVAWLDTSSSPPVASLTAPPWTSPTASLAVGATDPDDTVGGLRRECRLDAGTTWTPCSSAWSPRGLTPGRHTGYARVTDPSGRQSPVVTRSWSVDATAPTTTFGTAPSVLTSTTATLTWTATDLGGSRVASHDVRQRSAAPSGRLGGYVYPTSWRALRARGLAARLSPGYQYCWSVRARDVAGNVGPWSAERCTAVALDDRALRATSGWTRGTSTSAAYGTWSRARRSRVSLTRASVEGRRIALVVTTCPTCGSVDVVHAGRTLGRVSLRSPTTAHRQVRLLPAQSVTRSGTVVVRTTSSRTVYVDGMAVLH